MTIDELKEAFCRLSPDDQIDLARWIVWEEYEETEKQRKLSRLRHEVQKGIDSSNGGKNSRPLDEVFASLLKRRRKPAPTKRRQAVEA